MYSYMYCMYVYMCIIYVFGALHRETGRPRGFGHIDFKDAATAERAITELNGLEVQTDR